MEKNIFQYLIIGYFAVVIFLIFIMLNFVFNIEISYENEGELLTGTSWVYFNSFNIMLFGGEVGIIHCIGAGIMYLKEKYSLSILLNQIGVSFLIIAFGISFGFFINNVVSRLNELSLLYDYITSIEFNGFLRLSILSIIYIILLVVIQMYSYFMSIVKGYTLKNT